MTRTAKRRYRKAVWLHFDDEAPRIGSGWRPVIIAGKGRRWVRLVAPATGFGCRIPRRAFDAVVTSSRNREA